MRQTVSPAKLDYISDENFFREVPNPTESGNPLFYRIWEIDGLSTRLAVADTINVVSSSASDGSSLTVSIMGYVSGRLHTEVLTLNGTSLVSGAVTFDAREILIAKSGNTVGNLTFTEDSGDTTLVVLSPQEVSPRFKVVTLYPKPNSTLTIYLEYYKRVKELVNDTDAPEFDPKWHHVVRVGTLYKVYQHLGKTNEMVAIYELFRKLVRSMVASDTTEPDRIEHLRRRDGRTQAGVRLTFDQDVIV